MGKNQSKQVINIFLPINHTVLELAYLKRRTIVNYCRQPPPAEVQIKMATVEPNRSLSKIDLFLILLFLDIPKVP